MNEIIDEFIKMIANGQYDSETYIKGLNAIKEKYKFPTSEEDGKNWMRAVRKYAINKAYRENRFARKNIIDEFEFLSDRELASRLTENYKNNTMDKQEFAKFVKTSSKMFKLQEEAFKIKKELLLMENGEDEKEYNRNKYPEYEKDIQAILKMLSDTSQKLETAILKQEVFLNELPNIPERKEKAKEIKENLKELFKSIKSAKINAERKSLLY